MSNPPKDLSGQVDETGRITLEHKKSGKLAGFFPVDAREAVALGFWQLPGGGSLPEVERPKPAKEPDEMFIPGGGDPKLVTAFTEGPKRTGPKASKK
jgi:hypothetical protein